MTTSSSASSTPRAIRACSLGLSLAAALAGCGGEDKGRVSGAVAVVPPIDQCALAAQFEGLTIVDFDPWVQPNGRTSTGAHCDEAICPPGPFYFNHDEYTVLETGKEPACTPATATSEGGCAWCPRPEAATIDPGVGGDIGGTPIPEAERCGQEESALHFEISNMGTCFGMNGRPGWGGSLEVKLIELDASEYAGISFWVKKGSARSQPTLLLSVVDSNNLGTDLGTKGEDHCGCLPAGKNEVPICSADPDKKFEAFPDSRKCDPYGAAVTLTDDWTFVQAYFSKLHQKGFGKASGPFDSTKLVRLQFLVGSGDWDFWLDDVALFRAPVE